MKPRKLATAIIPATALLLLFVSTTGVVGAGPQPGAVAGVTGRVELVFPQRQGGGGQRAEGVPPLARADLGRTDWEQALVVLVFLLREALGRTLGEFGDFTRARKVRRVPVVLTREECQRLFAAREGVLRAWGVRSPL